MAEAIEAYHTAQATELAKQALLATGWGYLAVGDLVGGKAMFAVARERGYLE